MGRILYHLDPLSDSIKFCILHWLLVVVTGKVTCWRLEPQVNNLVRSELAHRILSSSDISGNFNIAAA